MASKMTKAQEVDQILILEDFNQGTKILNLVNDNHSNWNRLFSFLETVFRWDDELNQNGKDLPDKEILNGVCSIMGWSTKNTLLNKASKEEIRNMKPPQKYTGLKSFFNDAVIQASIESGNVETISLTGVKYDTFKNKYGNYVSFVKENTDEEVFFDEAGNPKNQPKLKEEGPVR